MPRVFVQDSWTLKRLTINPGVRFEWFNGSIPAREVAPGNFVPFRSFAEVKDLPNWKDVSPRFGMAWDIMGDGKTALKFGIGKYVRSYTTGFAETYDPNFYDTDTRTWGDTNGNDIARAGRTGSRARTSTSGSKASRQPADGIARPYQIESNLSLQREVLTGTSVTLSYFRRDYKNLIWTDNLAVDPSDYTPYDVPSPLGNGDRVTIYNLNPAKLGLVENLDQNSSRNSRVFHGLRRHVPEPLQGAQCVRRRQLRQAGLQHLRGRGSELPALLRPIRDADAVPDPDQAVGRLHAAVVDPHQRLVPELPWRRPQCHAWTAPSSPRTRRCA